MIPPAPFHFVAVLATRDAQLNIQHRESPWESANMAANLIRYHRRHVRQAVLQSNGDDAGSGRLARLLAKANERLSPYLLARRLRVVEMFSDPRAGQMLAIRAADDAPPIVSQHLDAHYRPFVMIPV